MPAKKKYYQRVTRKEIERLKKELSRLMRENQLMADQLVEMDDIKRENKRLKELQGRIR